MITVEHLHKSFKLFASPRDRLKEALTGKSHHTQHMALCDVSFGVQPGEILGVLGQNGAGKSTLLKLMTGVLLPDSGRIDIQGRVTGLLELGTGFNTELSGADNITANALMLGMSRVEIEQRREEIIAFSELGDYIHEPLRTYSSGMVMRLGFAIAIHADPACLLVDEALSVGDGYFQQKCMQRIRDFKAQGGTILFVSHDLNAVKVLCDRAIVLEGGHIVANDTPATAVNHYNRIMAKQASQEAQRQGEENVAFGTQEVVVTACQVEGQESQSHMISSGEVLNIHLRLKANATLEDIALGILVRDRFGQDVFGQNTHQHQQKIAMQAGEVRDVYVSVKADIAVGKYTLSAALHPSDHHLSRCYWWHDHLATFEVAGYRESKFSGICRLSCEFSFLTRVD
ncbi:ABC transporter ATP-binding protein [Halomonas vilamensis]|uniref:ABC transporter ATP-binding protein n=1 Tax=Vreelandella vilamensis TaxID=531309 RepID=A0ABU1H428_9GAMM|nr:ABC transporter ATP-binding protein [Halomonas vilamensis]MDR5899060.1 ABC transporter ATP-binding protein [Halomonas vilamensis]